MKTKDCEPNGRRKYRRKRQWNRDLVVLAKRGGYWWVDVKQEASETGKRLRIRYPGEGEAKVEAERRRAALTRNGTAGGAIGAALAEQATTAAELLAPWDVSLVEAVRVYVEIRKDRDKSITLGDAFDRFLAAKAARSEPYLRDIRAAKRKMEPLHSVLVCDLDRDDLRQALEDGTGGPTHFNGTLRVLRAVLSNAWKSGFAKENVGKLIDPKEKRSRKPPLLTLAQCGAIMGEATNLGCTAVTAAMLFGGVRPQEARELTWENVDFERGHLYVPAAVSKTGSDRYILLNDALRSWLVMTPKRERDGFLAGSGWRKNYGAIRKAAQLGQYDADCMRHAFASYFLGAGGSMGDLLEQMGHTTKETTLRHYRRAATLRDSREFWSRIRPKRRKRQGASDGKEVAA